MGARNLSVFLSNLRLVISKKAELDYFLDYESKLSGITGIVSACSWNSPIFAVRCSSCCRFIDSEEEENTYDDDEYCWFTLPPIEKDNLFRFSRGNNDDFLRKLAVLLGA